MRKESTSLIVLGLIVISSVSTSLYHQNIHRKAINELNTENYSLRLELNQTREEVIKLETLTSGLRELIAHIEEEVGDLTRQKYRMQSQVYQLTREDEEWDRLKLLVKNVTTSKRELIQLLMKNDITVPIEYLEITVHPRDQGFRIHDNVAFFILSVIPLNQSTITIWDEDGNHIWETDPLTVWEPLDRFMHVPYDNQTCNNKPMQLPENATLGDWTWKYTYDNQTIAEGYFHVDKPRSTTGEADTYNP